MHCQILTAERLLYVIKQVNTMQIVILHALYFLFCYFSYVFNVIFHYLAYLVSGAGINTNS